MCSVPPRPLGEPRTARFHLLTAMAFFAAGAAFLAWRGVDAASLQASVALLGMGGFAVLILGTMRLLIAGMAGRDVVGAGGPALGLLALAAAGALGAFVVGAWWAALPWSLAMAGHAVVVLLTVRRPAVRPVIGSEDADRATRITVYVLEFASLVYALASAVLVPAALAGRIGRAVAIHVLLVGFVVTTIFTVGTRILPRFANTRLPAWPARLLVPCGVAGPALVAYGLAGAPRALLAGALLEGAAFACFVVAAATMLARASRMRPTFLPYAGALLAVALGGSLALEFALGRITPETLAAHALLNTLGFVGLVVLGASTDLYAPALAAGREPARWHARVVFGFVLAGLAVGAAGAFVAQPLAARAGLALYALGLVVHLAGAVASHRRADRVLTRFSKR